MSDQPSLTAENVALDWRAREHWAARAARCEYGCGGVTRLRDEQGRAAHKVCAERAIEQREREIRRAG